MKNILGLLIGGLAIHAGAAGAQVSVSVSGQSVRIQQGGGNEVSVESGSIDPDVEMTGVAVINSEVFVDGVKVPAGKTSYTSKKTGKTYLIHRGKNGNVSVTER